MFGSSRRHRPPNPPLNSATANPNAASAAATAFMSASNQKPSRSLSSAAAAAALRARPHTPTNVGEVQTKRTMRRSASVSSAGSASTGTAGSRPTAQLQRKGSSGSMTERSFRSPSPHRAGSIHAPEEHPPVPQIPAGHKKAASVASSGVGMQSFRTASQKMKVGHSSWYTEPTGDPRNVRTSDAPMKTNKPQLQKPQVAATANQRPDSRNSVNFSYPTAFRAQSPPASPSSVQQPQLPGPPTRTPASPPRSNRASMSSIGSGRSDQQMVYDRNSRRMVPRTTVDNAEHYVRETTEKQPKKKYGGIQKEGGQLTKGTVARVRGTAVDADAGERDLPKREQPVVEEAPTKEESQLLEEPAVKAIITGSTGKSTQHQGELDRNQSFQPQDQQESGSPPPSRSTPHDPSTNSPAGRVSMQKASAGQGPKEISEEVNDIPLPSQKVIDALDSVPTRQSIFEQPEHVQLLIQETDETTNQTSSDIQHPKQAQNLLDNSAEKKAYVAENKPVLELSKEGSSIRRSNSNSPARQAHFSVTPSDSLPVRHTPLPRSASPIKSALKRTSPTRRETSPSDKSSDMSGSRGASPHQQDEAAAQRKKSVRVSFDDRTMATVVGESAPTGDTDESTPPSPQQTRRPWYSNIGRGKRREFTLEDDEIMKPRPALPSFGSIREKKTKETGERPLVRPYEPASSSATPSSPEARPSTSGGLGDTAKPEELSLGQSSDQAIGSVLSQAQTSRNAPNISRFREPLPPVVTSVEGSGYMSDSVGSSDSDDLLNSVTGASDTEEVPSTQATQLETRDNSQNNSVILEKSAESEVAPKTVQVPPQEVPRIAVIQPSPKVPEEGTSTANPIGDQDFDVPGGFPADGSEATHDAQNTLNETKDEAIFEPKAAIHPVQTETLPQTTLSTTTPLDTGDDESTDDSHSSIYSDAYEDLSDIDGDGFMSLNAVVEKPINEASPSQLSELSQQPQAHKQLEAATKSSESLRGNDWEQAKAFWRSLTAEKRLQLEREAMEEAGTEGDEEDVPHPVRRNSNRKKTTQQQQQQTTTEVKPESSKALAEPIVLVKSEKAQKSRPHSQPNPEPANTQSTSSRMRMSLRADKPGQADGIRKTMRSQSETGQVKQPTARRATQRETPAATSKPSQRQNATATTQISPTNRVRSSLPDDKPPLQRRGSDASDSSFKRSRAARNASFGFRSSMRPLSSRQSQDAPRGSGRFSLRSLSPTGSFQQSLASNAGGGTSAPAMRRTLRSGSASSQERTLPSIHFPSFGRSSKNPTAKRSKRSSRLGDSSDDDEGGIVGFRSRFEDSSDEDSIRPNSSSRNRPLSRGILRPSTAGGAPGFRKSTPVPEVDEDSPDLPDSDDEMPSPLQSPRARPPIGGAFQRSSSSAIGTAALTRSRSGRGSFNTSVSPPAVSGKERRSSLMGILRRNKKADSAGKIQRAEPTESAARRDTRLERSSEQLRGLRGDHPSSPKLQKRNSLRRNDSWPLGEPGEGEGVKRSNSAGNLLDQSIAGSAAQRPGTSGGGRSTSLGLPTAYDDERDNVTVDGLGQRKKKKFGALRRMFRLDD
ncbi:uncharacterized protein F4807DRAFT_219763 [Annulohypoxylon truncatum]|uniref:uncharacterized protein n=1 Tax=Annulohypoxylon truncatum TaxID=327061 RepID=UPI002008E03C|nr:uncharacterized protein F4807DRAFT_219763 [Annulohypoxylon truncatum]KAI1206674.1 hypothetical protein F4807DRAFT_219763 [Annulohypoxylon truncatum]